MRTHLASAGPGRFGFRSPGHIVRMLAAAAVLASFAAAALTFQQVLAANDEEAVGGLTLASDPPGTLTASWDIPDQAPTDYRVNWAKSSENFPSYTENYGNAYPTTNSHTVPSLDEGVEYKVRVRARYRGDQLTQGQNPWSTPWSETVTVTIASQPSPPGAPTGLTGTASLDRVELTWNDPQDSSITSYQVLRLQRGVHDPGDFQVHVDDTGSAATGYTDTDVEAEARYVYRIKARNAGGLSPRSNYFNANPAVPAAPTGLAGTVAHDRVELTWNDPQDSSITSYQVLRLQRGVQRGVHDPGDFQAHVDDTGSVGTNYTDTDVEAEARYVYRVKARNAGGLSARSNFFNANLPTGPAVPNAPTGLTSGSAYIAIALSWDDPGDDSITGYQVLRRDRSDADSRFEVLENDTGNAGVSYTDSHIAPGAEYEYQVKARNEHGLSAAGAAHSVDVPADPDAVTTGAIDLGDLTAVTEVRSPEYEINGHGDRLDYFRFTLTEPREVSLGLDELDFNADLALEDGEGAVLKESSKEGTADEAITITLLEGTYYVLVEAREVGVNRYKLAHGVATPNPDEVDELREKLQADEEIGAPTIETVTVTSHSLTLTWTAPDNASSVTAYDIRYKADDKWTVKEGAWSSGSLTYTLGGLADGTDYEAQVRAVAGDADGAWSATHTATTTDQGNTDSTATSLALGSSVNGRIGPAGDADVFSIEPDADVEVWIYTTGDTNTRGKLRRAGVLSVSNDDGLLPTNPLNFAIRAEITSGGTYYLTVQGAGPTDTGPYTLHVGAVTVAGDSTTTAPVITPGAPVATRLEAGAEHFFRIELTENTDLWALSIGDTITNGELLDAQSALIVRNFDSELHKREEQFTLRAELDPGAYFLKVTGDNRNTAGPYVLWVEGVSAPGSSLSDATRVHIGLPVPGRVTTSGDPNYFHVDLPVRTELILRAVGYRGQPTPVVPALTVTLYDSDGTDLDVYSVPRSYWAKKKEQGHLSVVARGLLPAGAYYISLSAEGDEAGSYTLDALVDDGKLQQEQKCLALGSGTFSDPLYGCQWHLKNTGQFPGGAGKDINVEPVWATGNLGQGINVAVFEGGVDSEHDDLKDNYLDERNHSFVGGAVRSPSYNHGTNAAGVIAARDNDIGGRGVAPRATLYHYRSPPGEEAITNAMIRDLDVTAVHNNSWRLHPHAHMRTASAAWEQAVERGVTEGYGGKGIVYVFSAGNADSIDSHTNLDERVNHYAVIPACAVSYNDVRSPYSETGDVLWVCAPSDDGGDSLPEITTTSENNGYTTTFGGTSAAAPIVSGVSALVRAANASLTWRDVKLVLAGSARKNHPTSDTWEQGELKYGSSSERYWFSPNYGFGVVDAWAAVQLAEGWTNLPPFRQISAGDSKPAQIRDAQSYASAGPYVTKTITLDSYVDFIEFIAIELTMTYKRYRHVRIELESPAGTTSTIAYPETSTPYILFGSSGKVGLDNETIRLGSARFMGEPGAGQWKLRIRDEVPGKTGTLHAWKLTAYGHGHNPGYPAITSTTPGNGTIAVEWEAPRDIGGSAITSYDLRYLRDRSSSWTVKTGVGTLESPAETLTGLEGGYEYQVQLRAVNESGPGPWSESMMAVTSPVRPHVPTRYFAIARDTSLEIRWSAPEHDGGSEVTGYEVRYILVSDFRETEDTDWTHEPSVGGTTMSYTITGLENETKYYVQVRAKNSVGPGPWSISLRGNTRDAN